MKKYLIVLLYSTVIVIFAGTNAFSWPWSPKPVKGELIFALGDVKVNSQKATNGTVINYKDVITTGRGSVARIRVANKTVIQLKQNSKLQYLLQDKEGELKLSQGWMSGVTRKIFTKEGKYRITTPTATAAIRGTSYCLKIENPESTYFCVCNGTINLKGLDHDHGDDVSAAHHAGKRFKLSNGLINVEDAGMLYHKDNDLEELAKIINEKIDWSNIY